MKIVICFLSLPGTPASVLHFPSLDFLAVDEALEVAHTCSNVFHDTIGGNLLQSLTDLVHH